MYVTIHQMGDILINLTCVIEQNTPGRMNNYLIKRSLLHVHKNCGHTVNYGIIDEYCKNLFFYFFHAWFLKGITLRTLAIKGVSIELP